MNRAPKMTKVTARAIVKAINNNQNGFRTLRECAELSGITREKALEALEVYRKDHK